MVLSISFSFICTYNPSFIHDVVAKMLLKLALNTKKSTNLLAFTHSKQIVKTVYLTPK